MLAKLPAPQGHETTSTNASSPRLELANPTGSSASSPEGPYDDPKGGAFRAALYPPSRKHFQFVKTK